MDRSLFIHIGPLPCTKFSLGEVYIARNAFYELPNEDIARGLARHAGGDWGNVSREEWDDNGRALGDGLDLLSKYYVSKGGILWVHTKADRSRTLVTWPH